MVEVFQMEDLRSPSVLGEERDAISQTADEIVSGEAGLHCESRKLTGAIIQIDRDRLSCDDLDRSRRRIHGDQHRGPRIGKDRMLRDRGLPSVSERADIDAEAVSRDGPGALNDS